MRDESCDIHSINTSYDQDDEQIAKLRALLISPEQVEIASIKERLNDPVVHAEEVSRVLAEAVVIRTSKDEKLAQALLPTIEKAIRDSIRKDPKFLANAIFPIIGPAIRKSIAESIRAMIQSLNETLTYSFSWQGIKWRMESIKTGKPFAEIVLLHTLIYSVEQLFLIHKETGLLLLHVSAVSSTIKDADMVSGMLSAIQDFVHDSFGVEEKHELERFNVGEYAVWIETGQQTALAAVIKGNAPEGLKINFIEALEHIEFEQSQTLLDFNGDPAPFAASKYHLEACLLQDRQNVKKPAIKL
ncbi:MAG: hypothetical protein WC231_01255 [Dehalococcoidales bacterium]|jgi:OOP family OmpA-OmpF porin